MVIVTSVGCAAVDATEADLIKDALVAVVHGGPGYTFNGPFVLMFLAWISLQTPKLNVTLTDEDGVSRLHVEVSRAWKPPHLSFSVFCWCLTQVLLPSFTLIEKCYVFVWWFEQIQKFHVIV